MGCKLRLRSPVSCSIFRVLWLCVLVSSQLASKRVPHHEADPSDVVGRASCRTNRSFPQKETSIRSRYLCAFRGRISAEQSQPQQENLSCRLRGLVYFPLLCPSPWPFLQFARPKPKGCKSP